MEKEGVEPSSSACKADVLPLNYIPKFFSLLRLLARRNYSTFASSGRNRVISQTRYTIQLPLNLVD
ncbi:MAG: hypothetical protein [Enterobacteria phage RP5]|nr:MAG: hypothetical protein [Enterobacteria phage RP5]